MLTTARLIMREPDESDLGFLIELLNDPDFLKYIGDRKVRTLDDARGYLERIRSPFAKFGFGMWTVTTKTGERLGVCGLVRRDSLPEVDVGFAFLPRFRGHGYAREATDATLTRASELGLTTLLAVCNADNHSSRKLLEAVGFRFERMTVFEGESEELCLYRRN